jgi:DNA-binding NarL/FixJ family response regulator
MSEALTRVLVADDHPIVTRGLVALLASMPDMSLVATATSGGEALELSREHRPDVVVMDAAMPGGDGMTATRRLREELPDTRVLVLSVHGDEETLFGALRAGARGYVVKGASHEQLERALRAVAAGEAVFCSGVSERVLQHFGADAPSLPDPLRALSDREREVLDLLASGLGTKEIGRRLFLSPKTVRNHIANIVAKLQLADRAHAIAFGRQAGLGETRTRSTLR